MKRYLFFLLLCATWSGLHAQEQFGIRFDGSAGSLVLCDDDAFDVGEGFTVEAWIFSPAWKPEFWQGSVVNKDGPGPDAGWALRAGKEGRLNLVLSVNEAWFEVDTEPIMNVNQWYHVAATVAGSTVTLYVNGVAQASGNFNGTPVGNDRPLTIGDSPGFPGRVFNGVIDEVRIWNYARTATQLNDNQMTEFAGTEDGLVTYLPFREGSGTTTANLADEDCSPTFTGISAGAWGDGYSVPAIDVGVSAISAPDVLSIFSRPVKTRVTINNYGSEAVTDVPVTLSVNAVPRLEATYVGTIEPGGTVELTFEDPLDLTGNNTNLLSVRTALAGDLNGLNDGTTLRYRKPATVDGNHVITLLDRVQHNFGSAGQTQNTTVNLPRDLERYAALRLHLSVECPDTGCDPWDQAGNISVVSPEGEYEIARFVTPFGIGCGGEEWIVDVTDFRDLLGGTVSLKSFIQVWGPSGWLLNADLELVEGDTPTFSRSTPIYRTQNHVYGDPDVDDDLPVVMADVAATTEESFFRLTMSGHGQGNTGNAAEFLERTHALIVNGQKAADHRLWKTDCADNACADQLGTWRFNRAGWCPGQAVQPWVYAFEDGIAGTELTLDYELQDYTNLLNTGYDGAGHTEPFYRIVAYLIEESATPFAPFANLRADSITVSAEGPLDNPTDDRVTLHGRNTGTTDLTAPLVALYVDGLLVIEETMDGTVDAGTAFTHTFSAGSGLDNLEDADIVTRVTAAGDNNVSDDATNAATISSSVAVTDAALAGVAVYPNPTAGRFTLDLPATFLGGHLGIVDATGRTVRTIALTEPRLTLTLEQKGLMVLRLTNSEGRAFYHKLIVR